MARPGSDWVIDGQKVWTSLAQFADWIFVLCRSEEGSRGSKGLSYLLVPMRQPGISLRPIREMTGEAEFNETFFDGARTAADNIVGAPGEGWKIAMGTLAFERGVSTLAQQMDFRNELDCDHRRRACATARTRDPLLRQRIADAHIGLKIMRYSALRMLTSGAGGALSHEAYTYRLHWGVWRKKLGELAMDVLGPRGRDRAPRAIRVRRAATHVPVLAFRHDLRRHEPDPAQPDRRARARPAARTPR